jgi:hypothetical protein
MSTASFSKAAFANMVMQLVQEGVLTLDKPVVMQGDRLRKETREVILSPQIAIRSSTNFPRSRKIRTLPLNGKASHPRHRRTED